MKTTRLIKEVLALPVEDRALIADSLLKSLNAPESLNDSKWIEASKRRLGELKTGKAKPIAGEDVFDKIAERFGK